MPFVTVLDAVAGNDRYRAAAGAGDDERRRLWGTVVVWIATINATVIDSG